MYDPQSFDHFAVEYDFAATLWRDHTFFLDRLPTRRRRALDLGCGSGGLVEALAPHFEHVLGIDISEPLLQIARQKRAISNVEYRHGDAETFEGIGPSEQAQGFDLIVSHTMLHHLRDQVATVAGLVELLAPGGRILLVDNVSWTSALPRVVFLISPWRGLPASVREYGWANAYRLLRFSLSKKWVDHLVSDRYLTEQVFRQKYGAALPGACMERRSVFMQLEWAPDVDATESVESCGS
jgi:SAM-dependent methyltransferase